MKKFKRISIFIVFFLVLGFIMSMLKHSGLWRQLMEGFSAIPVLMYFVYIILAFFLVILIHELGHLFSFVIDGIKIRALYVLLFVLKKTNKGWKFEIYFPLIKILGGLVVPDLPVITNDDEYDEVVRKFSKALRAGPIASIIYFIVSSLSFGLVWFLASSPYLLGLLAINAIVVTILTIFVMMASSISTDTMFGDFVANKKMIEDELFQMNQIIQYVSFSLKDHEQSNHYFTDKITKYYETKNTGYTLFQITLLMQYISMIIRNEDHIENKEITKKINRLNIQRLARSKHGLELAYLIAVYKYKLGDVDHAYETYFLINTNKNNNYDEEQLTFFKKHYAHILNINDHSSYFESLDSLYLGDLWLLKPIFDEKELLEELLFKLPLALYDIELYSNI